MNPQFFSAYSLYHSGSYEEALTLCDGFLAESSSDAASAYLKGLCICKLGAVEDGKPIIQAAIASNSVFQGLEFLSGLHAQMKKDWLWSLEKRLHQFLIFRAADAFLISYAKCGRTWLRLLLGKYVQGWGGG